MDAADLAAELPRESRCMQAASPDTARWGSIEVLLANIEYNTHMAYWLMSKDGADDVNRPRLLFADVLERERDKKLLTIEELNEFLSRPRKEVE